MAIFNNHGFFSNKSPSPTDAKFDEIWGKLLTAVNGKE